MAYGIKRVSMDAKILAAWQNGEADRTRCWKKRQQIKWKRYGYEREKKY